MNLKKGLSIQLLESIKVLPKKEKKKRRSKKGSYHMNPAPTATMAPLITPAFLAPTSFVSYLGKKTFLQVNLDFHFQNIQMMQLADASLTV